jgi:hypothetical protein
MPSVKEWDSTREYLRHATPEDVAEEIIGGKGKDAIRIRANLSRAFEIIELQEKLARLKGEDDG